MKTSSAFPGTVTFKLPALFAALTAVMDWWSRAPMLHEDVDMPAVVVSAARAAIAKSTTKHA